jgi:integrase
VFLDAKTVPALAAGRTYRDTEITGFACRVGAASRRFCFLYSHKGQSKRVDLGKYKNATSITEARGKAAAIRNGLDNVPGGYDPAAQQIAGNEAKRAAKKSKAESKAEARTVAEAWELYRADIDARVGEDALRPSTIVSIEKAFRLHIIPHVGDIELRALSSTDLVEMHRAASKPTKAKAGQKSTGGKYAANRAIDYLSSMLTWAVDQDWMPANPARKASKKRHKEKGRDRYLTDGEWTALERELDARPFRQLIPVGSRAKGRQMEERTLEDARLETFLSCEAIRLFLLTGCRKTEALSAEWSQFDLDRGIWTKPSTSTKQKKEHKIPLDPRAVQRLQAIRASHSDPKYVFPAQERLAVMQSGRVPKTGGPQKDVSKLWRTLRRDLNLPDVRLHDLRHSHASALVNDGVDILKVKSLLGHSTIRTTERYAHVADDPLREALAVIGKKHSARAG